MRLAKPSAFAARLTTALLITVLGSGCLEYTLDTTLRDDGSGVRETRLELTGHDDIDLSADDFRRLTHVSEAEGWEHRVRLDDDGDTVHVFVRALRIGALRDWERASGTFLIDGAVEQRAAADRDRPVRFQNRIAVRRTEESGGSVGFELRETFSWTGAIDAMVSFFVDDLDRRLGEQLPGLSAAGRGEIVGMTRARLSDAVRDGLLLGESDQEEALADLARRTAQEAVSGRRAGAALPTEAQVEAVLLETFADAEERLTDYVEQRFPGILLAVNSEVVYRLRLPGTILRTNADETEDGALVWRFSPADALTAPIEIVAVSRLQDGK
ncbi:MAG: hypothetical protein D6701_07315 [Gemmatimonadetes bacterium]|nr:MAG: hypothetical protein D6701_07315 [Gemmatimonadota bacterium]